MTSPGITSEPRLAEVAAHLDEYLCVASYPNEEHGVLRPSNAPVRTIGLALDVASARSMPELGMLDVLVLHRWWGFEELPLHPSAGVLGYHLPFDHRVTLGDNPRLAAQLSMWDVQVLHDDRGYAIGMIGNVPAVSVDDLEQTFRTIFGGLDSAAFQRRDVVRRIAVVGAMTDTLVNECSARGANVYVTGQLRKPAAAAVEETSLGVIAVGHARAERWGLRCLREVLRERWVGLRVVIAPATPSCPLPPPPAP